MNDDRGTRASDEEIRKIDGKERGRPTKFANERSDVRVPEELGDEQIERFIAAARIRDRITYERTWVAYPRVVKARELDKWKPGSASLEEHEAEARQRFPSDLHAWARFLLACFPTDEDAVREIREIPAKELASAFIKRVSPEGGALNIAIIEGLLPKSISVGRSKVRKTLRGFPSAAKFLGLPIGTYVTLRAVSAAAFAATVAFAAWRLTRPANVLVAPEPNQTDNTIAFGGFAESAIAYDGNGYGAVYMQAKLAFQRLDARGWPVGHKTVFSTSASDLPGIAWSSPSSRYGVVWKGMGVLFQCVEADGALEGTPLKLSGSNAQVFGAPSISKGEGDHFGVVWVDDRSGTMRLYFQRIDARTCKPIGEQTNVSILEAYSPSVAYGDRRYGIAWRHVREIHFSRLDATGKVIESLPLNAADDAVSGPGSPVVAYNKSLREWGIVWDESLRGGSAHEIFFAHIGFTGPVLGKPIQVTNAGVHQRYLSLAAGGAMYGLVWVDGNDGTLKIGALDEAGRALSRPMPLRKQSVGSVASDGNSFLCVYMPGRSRRIPVAELLSY